MLRNAIRAPSIPPRSDDERELQTTMDDVYESLDSLEEGVENLVQIAEDALSPSKVRRDRPPS
jgi:hypothetical protein